VEDKRVGDRHGLHSVARGVLEHRAGQKSRDLEDGQGSKDDR
jgi:hypothetical protein